MHDNGKMVVPYDPVLLRIFIAHINIEITNVVKFIKYVGKYITKGKILPVIPRGTRPNKVDVYSKASNIWLQIIKPIFSKNMKVNL